MKVVLLEVMWEKRKGWSESRPPLDAVLTFTLVGGSFDHQTNLNETRPRKLARQHIPSMVL